MSPTVLHDFEDHPEISLENLLAWNHCPAWTWFVWVFRKATVFYCAKSDNTCYYTEPDRNLSLQSGVTVSIGSSGHYVVAHQEKGQAILDVPLFKGGQIKINTFVMGSTLGLIYLRTDGGMRSFLEHGNKSIPPDCVFVGYDIVRRLRWSGNFDFELFDRSLKVIPKGGMLIDKHPSGAKVFHRSTNFPMALFPSLDGTINYTLYQDEDEEEPQWPWSWTRFGGLVSPNGFRVIHSLHGSCPRWKHKIHELFKVYGAQENFRGDLICFSGKKLYKLTPDYGLVTK